MGDWSGKQLFMTWKNSICCRMFLTYLTWYGVSKVSLLLVAICWLLGRLDPKWAILLKFPTVLCWFSRGDLYILSFPFDFFFQFVPIYIYIVNIITFKSMKFIVESILLVIIVWGHSRLGYYFWVKGLKDYVAIISAFIMIFYYLINKF